MEGGDGDGRRQVAVAVAIEGAHGHDVLGELAQLEQAELDGRVVVRQRDRREVVRHGTGGGKQNEKGRHQ